jgi:hypothetical protein
VRPGQRVSGHVEHATKRLDVRPSLIPAEQALNGFRQGTVALAKIAAVGASRVTVMLHPAVTVGVTSDDVASADLLTDLFSVDEVVRVKLESIDPFKVSFDDVDSALPSVAVLLPGGPPWLTEPEVEDRREAEERARLARAACMRRLAHAPLQRPEPEPVPAPPLSAKPARPKPPSPLELAKRRGIRPDVAEHSAVQPLAAVKPTKEAPLCSDGLPPAAPMPVAPATPTATPAPAAPARPTPIPVPWPGPAPGPTEAPLTTQVEVLTAQRDRAKFDLQTARDRITRMEDTVEALRREREQSDQRGRDLAEDFHAMERELEHMRTRLRQATGLLRKAKKDVAAPATCGLPDHLDGAYTDPEAQLCFEIEVMWATRVTPQEKPAYPLAEYSVGSEFCASLDALQGIDRAKVLEVIVDVLTGRAQELHSRALHRRRESAGGPYMVRDDGAKGWRVAIQRAAAGGRRLHYWQLGSHFELDKVGLHDDTD